MGIIGGIVWSRVQTNNKNLSLFKHFKIQNIPLQNIVQIQKSISINFRILVEINIPNFVISHNSSRLSFKSKI